MRIVMLETRSGCEDGFIVRYFRKHRTYELADTLARTFINAGWAVEFRLLR